MSNPSLIWGQLSMPNPPAGSIPFVASDNATIITDVLNFSYDPVGLKIDVTNGIAVAVTDISATPGNSGTIPTASGRCAISAGNSVFTVACPLATLGDMVQLQLETNDATLTRAIAIISGNGIITVTGNANATGVVKFSFILIKAFVP